MINQLDNGLDLNFDVDPEERKRRLALLNGLYNGGEIKDLASNLIDQRLQPVQQAIENPQQAFNQRLGLPQQQPQPVTGPAVPQMPDETQAETQRLLQQNQQPTPMAPAVPNQPSIAEQTVAAGAPQQLAPINPNEPKPELPPMPQVSEGVQVAGPMVEGALPKQPEVPQWSKDLSEANGDMTKLHAIAGNPNYPPEARRLAGELTAKQYKQMNNEQEATQTLTRAFSGQDPKALNSVISDLRKNREEGSYLKAILYQRLGLTELAREEQQKLGAGSKIGQAMLDRQQYTVEYGGNGDIIRAWDSNGTRVADNQLAKISAGGMKAGSHAFGFTGERAIVPQGQPGAGEEVVPYNNSITGLAGYVFATGPNKGHEYTGSTPISKSVQTQGMKAEQGKQISLAYDPVIRAAERGAGYLGEFNAKYGTNFNILGYGQNKQPIIVDQNTNQILRPNAQGVVTTTTTGTNVSAGGGTVTGGNVGGGTITAGGNVQPPIAGGRNPAQIEQNMAIGKVQAETNIGVAGKRSESFNKHVDETITPDAINGDTVGSLRRQQFAIFNRPDVDPSRIFGIANGVGQIPGDQRWTMFRDILLGKVSKPEDEIRQRAAQLGLNPSEQSAVAEYAIANAEINSKTLKSTAGPGSVSDAEQRANRERNIDPTKIPMLGGYNAMAQSQFNGDLAKYKGDWSVTSKATNTAQLESDWRKEKQKLTDSYIDMAKQRLDYISKNGNSSTAIKNGYTFYPVPTYDASTGTWIIKKPLSSYERK